MATWAIGDVHGCYRTLRALLDSSAVAGSDDLWLVGDLVNRGPRSLETLRFVADLGDRATVVLGNHDVHFLSRAAGLNGPGQLDTLDELLAAPDLDALSAWLSTRPLTVVDAGWLLVHAGVLASWNRAEIECRARSVERALRSAERDRYLEAFRPRRKHGGRGAAVAAEVIDSLRVMTLMRTVDAAGAPTFDFTGPLEELPDDRIPWFELPAEWMDELRVVCGHWAALGLMVRDRVVALDSGCAWGGPLSALRLEDGRVHQMENLDR